MTRNEYILKSAGKKSFTLIATELGTTRNVVAGVVWRSKWPLGERICSPNSRSSPNKCGLGHWGPGDFAPANARHFR